MWGRKTFNNRPLQLLIILCRVYIPAVRSPYATDLQNRSEISCGELSSTWYVIDFFDRQENSDPAPRRAAWSPNLSA